MARNALSCATIPLAVVVASTLFVIAIITRDFWLSLGLGIGGTILFASAVFLLREARKSLPDDENLQP